MICRCGKTLKGDTNNGSVGVRRAQDVNNSMGHTRGSLLLKLS